MKRFFNWLWWTKWDGKVLKEIAGLRGEVLALTRQCETFRDCFKNEQDHSRLVTVSRDAAEAQLHLARAALDLIANVGGRDEPMRKTAIDANAKLNDPTKSQNDWAALKPSPIRSTSQETK